MTAAAWARGERSPSTTTAQRLVEAASSRPRAFIFSADETTDVGYESGTTVSPDYTAHTSRFTGRDSTGCSWTWAWTIRMASGLDPEERLRVAMARRSGLAPVK